MSELTEDEPTVPRAAMNKMIKETLPNIRVANEARELILNCCTEFIHLLSSEANEVCNRQQKKTINAEHVLNGEKKFLKTLNQNIFVLLHEFSLEKLGFGDYISKAEEVLKDCKEVLAKKKKHSSRLENLGIPEEELLRQQQELFAKAREEQLAVEVQQWQQLQAEAQRLAEQQQIHTEGSYDDDDG